MTFSRVQAMINHGQGPSAAGRVFGECAGLADEHGASLLPLASQLRLGAQRLGEPMRLAVAGQIKRGKSTLVNALLGEEVASTGQLELTFTVSEFSWDDRRAVYVHYNDGGIEGPLAPEVLESLTIRDPARAGLLQTIRKVRVTMPNEFLRTFRLVDTPGLGSVHLADSQNATDFLGISSAFTEAERSAVRQTLAEMGRTARDVHEDSVREIEYAGAVLYLFNRGLHEGDYATVTQFLGPGHGSVTPLRAFAALSHCDKYWPPGPDLPGNPDPVTYDPMAVASQIAERYLARPGLDRLFFTIVPIAGLVGIGARLLTDQEFCWLDDLRRTDRGVLARRLRDAARFADAEQLPGVPLPAAQRARLIRRLGGWGTHLACGYLRDGLGKDQTRDRLVADSGTTRLRGLIAGHFGNRASVIKLDQGIGEVKAEIGRCRLRFQRAGAPVPEAVAVIASRVQELSQAEHGPAEAAVLSAYYGGTLALTDDEIAEILTVTGEHGTTCAARLGLPEDAPVREQEDTARRLAEKWAIRENDPELRSPAATSAIRTIRRSYDRLLHRLTLARQLLDMTDEPDVAHR